ncbi:MAG: hypothetical protein D6741_13855, partial [Planctomycetota bacterium]
MRAIRRTPAEAFRRTDSPVDTPLAKGLDSHPSNTAVAMRRLIRMGIGLAAVAATYWLYAWAVVPWIEPSPAEGLQASSGRFGIPADVLLDRRLAELAPLFPGRTDVLARAKMLESEDVKLLLVEYHNLGGGVVQIKPCYVVYAPRTPDGHLDPETAVVLEA